MAVTTLQSNLVPIEYSTDSGTTYLKLVCNQSWTLNQDTSVSEEETDCGILIGIGVNKWSFDAEGVLNTTPASGEASAEALQAVYAAQTLILVRTQYPASGTPGGDLYAVGSAYITKLTISKSTGSLMKFSATFSGTGTLDTTA